jgi:hypothetical protein
MAENGCFLIGNGCFWGLFTRKWRINGWEWIEMQFKWSKIAKIDSELGTLLMIYKKWAMVEKWILCSFPFIFEIFTPFLPSFYLIFSSFFLNFTHFLPHFNSFSAQNQ